jgi:hypothetical protein
MTTWTQDQESKPAAGGRLTFSELDELIISTLRQDADALLRMEEQVTPLDWQVDTLGGIVRELDAAHARLAAKRNRMQ